MNHSRKRPKSRVVLVNRAFVEVRFCHRIGLPYVFSAEFVLQPAGAGIPLSAIRLSGLE
jgi:hypothetical protein